MGRMNVTSYEGAEDRHAGKPLCPSWQGYLDLD